MGTSNCSDVFKRDGCTHRPARHCVAMSRARDHEGITVPGYPVREVSGVWAQHVFSLILAEGVR